MDNKELRKKLSVLKSAPVPKGYWENYWPRLSQRLAAAQPSLTPTLSLGGRGQGGPQGKPRVRDAAPFFYLWVPAMAAVLPILIGVFWLGQRSEDRKVLRIPHVRLASYQEEERAKHVFQEMLQLFPNRVNWITYVNGKVDFSISSVAYKDAEPLVPFVITIPRSKGGFEARVLMRPGQEAGAHAPWSDHATIDLKWHLDALAQAIHMSCRISEADLNASVEGDMHLRPNQGTVLGAIRWRSELLQVQLIRLRETDGYGGQARADETKPKAESKPEPLRT